MLHDSHTKQLFLVRYGWPHSYPETNLFANLLRISLLIQLYNKLHYCDISML